MQEILKSKDPNNVDFAYGLLSNSSTQIIRESFIATTPEIKGNMKHLT